jgi:SAM-dependent methyltransferase
MPLLRSQIERTTANFAQVGSVLIDVDWRKTGVTEQFLSEAETYDDRYYKSPWWRYLVERGLSTARVDRGTVARVLDIGSGSGNTVLPALEFLPNASVVACDISPQLLNLLHKHLTQSVHAKRDVLLYCFDLHKDLFQPDRFDLVVGGAVLHHMLDPRAALENAARWLRPGGQMILYEPFDYGAHLFATLFQLMIDCIAASMDANDQACADLFRAFRQDINARLGVPVVKPWTAELDDKWYFNLEYLRRLASDLGLHGPVVSPLTDDFERYFHNNVSGMMSAAGHSHLKLRQDVQSIVDEFDAGISARLKARMLLEGIVVFSRP